MNEQRKHWIIDYHDKEKEWKKNKAPEEYLYMEGVNEISFEDFINVELIHYTVVNNIRSLPCLVDGYKPSQRKVMNTCFKCNDRNDVKVAQLAGSVSEQSAYHHGEASLMGTIVNLAHDFVGSNNINSLEPKGQFGTRLMGGKDSASPRYIFTKMSDFAKIIFNPADGPLLNYLTENNQQIEPEFFIPIVPLVLINGAKGVGVGFSTDIPNFNPRDIVANLKLLMKGKKPKPTKPWYKNFNGEILKITKNKYLITGVITQTSDIQVVITELPVGTWTTDYREKVLEPLLNATEEVAPQITITD